MTTATYANNSTVSAPRVMVRGNYWLTQQQLQDWLDESTKRRERYKAQLKAESHSLLLTDDDYDRIAGWMEAYRARWLQKHGEKA